MAGNTFPAESDRQVLAGYLRQRLDVGVLLPPSAWQATSLGGDLSTRADCRLSTRGRLRGKSLGAFEGGLDGRGFLEGAGGIRANRDQAADSEDLADISVELANDDPLDRR